MSLFPRFAAVCLLVFTTSCVETVVVGSVTGSYLTVRDKSFMRTKDDVTIATKLGTEFVANGLKNPGNSVDITVNEGRILLTGIVRDADKGMLAAELAWKVKGAKEVIDEIQLRNGDNIHFKDYGTAFTDYVITLEIEGKLLFKRQVASVNYKITTVNHTVYLLGVAENNEEVQKVLAVAAKVRGVEKVVNHIILADDRRRG